MTKKTTSLFKSKRPKQYFVIFNDELFSVPIDFFDVEVQNYDHAVQFGMAWYKLLKTVLKDEAIDQKTVKLGKMKLTTGLIRSLEELDRRFPCVLEVIRSHDVSFNGQRIFKS